MINFIRNQRLIINSMYYYLIINNKEFQVMIKITLLILIKTYSIIINT